MTSTLMKYILSIITIVSLLIGCSSDQKFISEGRITYEGTSLILGVPDGWLVTKISSSIFPTIYTEIDYGIKPNLQLEEFFPHTSEKEQLESYLQAKIRIYSDYAVVEKTQLPIPVPGKINKMRAVRRNSENIPLTHFIYSFSMNGKHYIFSATCAEPKSDIYEKVFDGIILSASF